VKKKKKKGMNCNLREETRLSIAPSAYTETKKTYNFALLGSTTGTCYFDSGFLVPRFLMFYHCKLLDGEGNNDQNALSQQKFEADTTRIPTLWRRVLLGQEIPPFSCNPKVHNHDHNSPPLGLILSQINSAHCLQTPLLSDVMLVLYCHLCVGLLSDLFPPAFHTINRCPLLSFLILAST
jgi:hypothetical protein